MSYVFRNRQFAPPRLMMGSSGQGVGDIINAAGIRVTTRNDALDAAIKWGFWGTMAYLFYKMAKLALKPFPAEYGV